MFHKERGALACNQSSPCIANRGLSAQGCAGTETIRAATLASKAVIARSFRALYYITLILQHKSLRPSLSHRLIWIVESKAPLRKSC